MTNSRAKGLNTTLPSNLCSSRVFQIFPCIQHNSAFLLYCSGSEGASNYNFGLANKRPYSHAGVEIIWFIYVYGAGIA